MPCVAGALLIRSLKETTLGSLTEVAQSLKETLHADESQKPALSNKAVQTAQPPQPPTAILESEIALDGARENGKGAIAFETGEGMHNGAGLSLSEPGWHTPALVAAVIEACLPRQRLEEGKARHKDDWATHAAALTAAQAARQVAAQAEAAQLSAELSKARDANARARRVCVLPTTAAGLSRAMGGPSAATLASAFMLGAQTAAQAAAVVRAAHVAALAAAQATSQEPEWQCLTDGSTWTTFDRRGAAPMRFDLIVNGTTVPYHADLARMWTAVPSDGSPSLLSQWSASPATVWQVSGLSLQVANAGSLRTRESLELNIALGHAARMCGTGQQPLPVRVDVFEVPAAVRARIEAARTRLGGGEEWVFHGTADATIGQIFQQGFKVGGDAGVPVVNGNAIGRGVYSDTLLTTSDSQCDSWSAVDRSSWRIFRSGDQLLPMYDRVFGLALPGPHLNGPNASIGPIEAKLNTVKPIRGIVIGAFGEVSADTHSLVKEIAAQGGRKMYALMGVSPMEAAARIKKQLIDTIGTIAARGHAQLLLARLSALAPIAAQRGNTTNSNQQIISLNALARAHYRRSIGTRADATKRASRKAAEKVTELTGTEVDDHLPKKQTLA
ncbi:hypothetical protein T492DRAFT_874642 [Pavlovales sp. CCMP2436]|nr:hypothetical protein T492DRAFT_874642 [Pavlovales sp. CCMP2436]